VWGARAHDDALGSLSPRKKRTPVGYLCMGPRVTSRVHECIFVCVVWLASGVRWRAPPGHVFQVVEYESVLVFTYVCSY
jgi:hypothetical protein